MNPTAPSNSSLLLKINCLSEEKYSGDTSISEATLALMTEVADNGVLQYQHYPDIIHP